MLLGGMMAWVVLLLTLWLLNSKSRGLSAYIWSVAPPGYRQLQEVAA